MQKLTQADFSGAPEWVKSAAVDSNGKGYWFAVNINELSIEGGEWLAPMDGDYFAKCESIGFSWTRFAAADWQNSAINRDCYAKVK